jgi:mannose-6-phosphate isomerase-like protein (cupin superfamily)
MGVRRVVTGHSESGKAVIVADEEVASISIGGMAYDPMWASDLPAIVPNDGSIPSNPTFFPGPGAARVFTWTAEPASSAAAMLSPEEVEHRAPGLLAHMEVDEPGMHTTQTIDIDVVLSGEIWLEVDDGVETKLTSGDVVIQNGTRHRWHNRTNEPATILSAILGAWKA